MARLAQTNIETVSVCIEALHRHNTSSPGERPPWISVRLLAEHSSARHSISKGICVASTWLQWVFDIFQLFTLFGSEKKRKKDFSSRHLPKRGCVCLGGASAPLFLIDPNLCEIKLSAAASWSGWHRAKFAKTFISMGIWLTRDTIRMSDDDEKTKQMIHAALSDTLSEWQTNRFHFCWCLIQYTFSGARSFFILYMFYCSFRARLFRGGDKMNRQQNTQKPAL